jgi:hypothetical protein
MSQTIFSKHFLYRKHPKIFPQIHPFLNSGIMVTFSEMATYEEEVEGENS